GLGDGGGDGAALQLLQGAGQRERPVVLVECPRQVRATPAEHGVFEGGGDDGAGSAREERVRQLHDLVGGGVVGNTEQLQQSIAHDLDALARVGAGPRSGDGGQVVGGDCGQCLGGPLAG